MSVDLDRAHRHSAGHRAQWRASERCGCCFCLAVVSPQAIDAWIDAPEGADADRDGNEVGATALCPAGGVDAVIGAAAGFALPREFQQALRQRWFGPLP